MSIFTRFTWEPCKIPEKIMMGEYKFGHQRAQIDDYTTAYIGVSPRAYDGRIIIVHYRYGVHLDSISPYCWEDLDKLLGDTWAHDMVQYSEDIVQELEDEER